MNETQKWLLKFLIMEANEFLSDCYLVEKFQVFNEEHKENLYKKLRSVKSALIRLDSSYDKEISF